MYKKVVVGIAIINSPIETYITYLAVKAGWDKAQIARYVYCFIPLENNPHQAWRIFRKMLYHLIDMNPTRDFTLHVSTNSSAMVRPLRGEMKWLIDDFLFVASCYITNSDSKQRNL
jgi:hypothetical protein